MKYQHFRSQIFLAFVVLASIVVTAAGQRTSSPKTSKDAKMSKSSAVLWEPTNIGRENLFYGPGGRDMQPDLSRITFIKEKKGGHSTKYEIRDGSGVKWVAKIGIESQPETAAVRLLSAIGYKTEISYLVPRLTIPGKGTFSNVRLEARPEGVKRGNAWSWGKSPFEGTREMDGLKIMMAFITNWDTKNSNNEILTVNGQRQYIISDLGSSFGKTGKVSWPLFWRFGRSRNKPTDYASGKFVTGVKGNRPQIHFNGVNRGPIRDVKLSGSRWLAGLLDQLSDNQIRDAFRAANYSQSEINLLTRGVRKRINELHQVTDNRRIGGVR